MSPCRFALAGLILAGVSGCITIEGQSSAEMKEAFLSSYLVQSVKKFYPNGVPDDPAKTYPALQGRELRSIESELRSYSTQLAAMHEKRVSNLRALLGRNDIPNKSQAKVQLVNRGGLAASTDSAGQVVVDVRVLQSIFRGALLDAHRSSPESPFDFDSPRRKVRQSKYDPFNTTEDERAAIGDLLKTIKKVEDTPARSMIGDFIGMVGSDSFDRAPWFAMAGHSMSSSVLQSKYVGAVLFLLAHEQGHIAMNHHARLTQETLAHAQLRADIALRAQCELRKQFEEEADVYAFLLLSPFSHAQSPMDAFAAHLAPQIQQLTGYQSFFEYGYNLAGFQRNEASDCGYESNDARLAKVRDLDDVIRKKGEDQMQEVMTEMINRMTSAFNKELSKIQDQEGGKKQ